MSCSCHVIPSHPTLSHLIPSNLTNPISSHLHVLPSHLISSLPILSHLIQSHRTSSHFISSPCNYGVNNHPHAGHLLSDPILSSPVPPSISSYPISLIYLVPFHPIPSHPSILPYPSHLIQSHIMFCSIPSHPVQPCNNPIRSLIPSLLSHLVPFHSIQSIHPSYHPFIYLCISVLDIGCQQRWSLSPRGCRNCPKSHGGPWFLPYISPGLAIKG